MSQAEIGVWIDTSGALAPLAVPPPAAKVRSITPGKNFEIVLQSTAFFASALCSSAFGNTLTMGTLFPCVPQLFNNENHIFLRVPVRNHRCLTLV